MLWLCRKDCLPQLQALLVSSLHQQQGIRRLINQVQGKTTVESSQTLPRPMSAHNLTAVDNNSSVDVVEAEKEMHNLVVDLQQRNHILEEKNEVYSREHA